MEIEFKAGDRVRFVGIYLKEEDDDNAFVLLPGATGIVEEELFTFFLVTWDDNEHTVGCKDRTGWPMTKHELEHINEGNN